MTKWIDNLANLFIFKSNTYVHDMYPVFSCALACDHVAPEHALCCQGDVVEAPCTASCVNNAWSNGEREWSSTPQWSLDFLEVATSGGGWVYGKGLSSGRFVYSSVLRPQHCVQLHPRPCCRCPRPTWLLPRDTSAHNSAHVALNH